MDDEVMRQYSVLPAIEQTKIMIINKINLMFDIVNKIMQDKILGRKDDDVISLLKSTVISTYILLKPKIYEHINAKSKYRNDGDLVSPEVLKQLFEIDKAILNPSQFTIEEAITFADIINLFCHEYGITKITYFAGTTKQTDINVIR